MASDQLTFAYAAVVSPILHPPKQTSPSTEQQTNPKMKHLILLLTTLATAAQAGLFFGSSPDIAPFDDDDVPGDNPLQHCADPEGDILELEEVDLDPNPPKPGKKLTITATGHLNQKVEKGAKIHLQVKYGLITIIKQTADLCDTIKNVDLKCPLDEGDVEIEKDVDLPKQIPPGKYNVIADVYTKDEEKVTCLTATVEFKRGGGGDDDDDDDKKYHEDM